MMSMVNSIEVAQKQASRSSRLNHSSRPQWLKHDLGACGSMEEFRKAGAQTRLGRVRGSIPFFQTFHRVRITAEETTEVPVAVHVPVGRARAVAGI